MNELELEQQGAAFIERFASLRANERAAANLEGAALATRLRVCAIDLCHNKATEFSPAIGRLFELAAKVALVAHWPDQEAIALYEKDVRFVYGQTTRSERHARDYLEFRRAYLESLQA